LLFVIGLSVYRFIWGLVLFSSALFLFLFCFKAISVSFRFVAISLLLCCFVIVVVVVIVTVVGLVYWMFFGLVLFLICFFVAL